MKTTTVTRMALGALVIGGLVLALMPQPVEAGAATLTANPSEVVILVGNGPRDTKISWSTGSAKKGVVKLSTDGGDYEPFAEGKKGIEVFDGVMMNHTYEFRLFNKNDEPLTPVRLVNGQKPPPHTYDYGCAKQCITDVDVEPHGTYVELHIKTDEPAKYRAAVSKQAPGPDGELFNQAGLANSTLGDDYTDYTLNVIQIQPDTLYHYVVKAEDFKGRTAWKTGTFKTLKRKLVVNYTQIQMINDSDPSSTGECVFSWHVNGSFGGVVENPNLGDGQTMNPNFHRTVNNAPDVLTVKIVGYDQDELNTTEGSEAEANFQVAVSGLNEAYTDTWAVTANEESFHFIGSGTFTVSYVP